MRGGFSSTGNQNPDRRVRSYSGLFTHEYYCYWESILDCSIFERSCFVCWASKHIQCCHLNAFCFGGNGNKENIVLLCKDCHERFDGLFLGKTSDYESQIEWLKNEHKFQMKRLTLLLDNGLMSYVKDENDKQLVNRIIFSKRAKKYAQNCQTGHSSSFRFTESLILFTIDFFERKALKNGHTSK